MNPKNLRKLPGSPDEWLDYARSDLKLARLAAGDASIRPEQACFHTQQAAEKAIKAVLLSRQVGFPLTHDIEELLELVEESGVPVPKAVENAGLLTPYAVETRYPGYWLDLTEPDVEEALQTAETVLSWANSLLPASGGEKQ